MSNQPQLFETEDQYGNDIIQGPKLNKRKLTTKEAMIDPKNLDPFNSTSFGTGELILDAVKNGAKKIILGIGGSATNDCGIGVAKAVGIRFLDSKNNEVGNNVSNFSNIKKINLDKFNSQLNDIKFEVACDVTNKLCGKEGASYIYGTTGSSFIGNSSHQFISFDLNNGNKNIQNIIFSNF